MLASVLDNLLNNIWLLTVLIVLFILVAVAVVLYFLVFRKKIKEKVTAYKHSCAVRAEETANAKDLAYCVFEERDSDVVRRQKEESEVNAQLLTKLTGVTVAGAGATAVEDDGKAKAKKPAAKTAKAVAAEAKAAEESTQADFDFGLMKGPKA